MITINLNETYSLTFGKIDAGVSIGEFYSPQIGNEDVLMRVIVKPHSDPLLTNVYNLAMGPTVGQFGINDKVRLKHVDSSRVFSTAVLFALTFLTEYPNMLLGLDGSDDLRATLYHSMFIANRETMNEFFITIGVDWYVKLLRNQIDIERRVDGSPFFKPRPEAFDYERTRHDLYRYYMLKLKD